MPRTLSFVINGDAVLLMKRAPHKRVFPNQYNGLGGHLNGMKTRPAARSAKSAKRAASPCTPCDYAAYTNIDSGAASGILLFVYTAISDTRAISSDSPEGKLEWIRQDRILGLDLVEDLPQLLPRILSMVDDAPPLHAHVSYDADDEIQLRFHEDA